MMAKLSDESGDIRSGFDEIVDHVLPTDADMQDRLRARMAFDTVSAALFAALGQEASDDDVLAAARTATTALTA